VAPGFDFADFELAETAVLLAAFPQHETWIRRLT
jgi:predicted cupin superfamily sugar epimerase